MLRRSGQEVWPEYALTPGHLAGARRQVVQLLGTGPQRAGELAAAAGTSAPAMSRRLRVLLQAGIVADERTAQDARARDRRRPVPGPA